MKYKYKVFVEHQPQHYCQVTDFLRIFQKYFTFVPTCASANGLRKVKARCLWWFVNTHTGFDKRKDVNGICEFSAKYPHVPIVIIYLEQLGEKQRVSPLDMEAEIMDISLYLENSTGNSDLAVLHIPYMTLLNQNDTQVYRLVSVTRDLCYYYTILIKWFAAERHPQYPAISDCDVELYHDACHSLNGNNLFSDVWKAWNDAQRLILIMGWSLDHRLRLNRFNGIDETVGEILCRKAHQGVLICIFLWEDMMDFMGTNNIQTKNYFKQHCPQIRIRLRRRQAAFGQYSHHQKLIICDSPTQGLIAFVGGLDITKGRFDTPRHELFSTLNNVHSDDFYNSITDHKRVYGAPREPWHDCHAQVRGDVVWDMLNHFRGHFLLDYNPQKRKNLEFRARIYQMISDLYPGNISEISTVSGAWMTEFYSSVTMSQMFKKRVKVDDGIHRAYAAAINNADKFIYIENQYFTGGSYHWLEPVTKRARLHAAPNSVSVLLADRIIHKAIENEPFKVYIIIPQMPDGKPGTLQVDGVLYFQFKTIQMMYHRISTAFKRLSIHKKVEDYLMFACLGKVEWNPMKQSYENFFIYVHSKLMIVDDEFLIVGSANLNSRSLSGKRDSEICIGCSEAYMNTGKISAFRNCLWREHFGIVDEVQHLPPSTELEDTSILFDPELDPSDDQVFNKFRDFAYRNAELFNSKQIMLNRGKSHLMKLPIEEDPVTGACIPKKIVEFDLKFDGRKPSRLLPFTIFT